MLLPQNFDPNTLATLRGDAIDVCAGTAFIVIGVATLGIALVRRRAGVRIFYWLALWSILYGITPLWSSLTGILPRWMQVAGPYAFSFTSFMVLPFASLSFMEATRGWMRRFSAILVMIELAIAAAAFVTFLAGGNARRWLLENNLVAAFGLLALLVVVGNRTLFERC
ncbi:MAG TPA: hypothetical protein VGL89_14040 [Candidatus Koribacter sp.]|jgi:hypothetical protein